MKLMGLLGIPWNAMSTEIWKVIRSNGNQGGLRKFELETEPAGQLRLRPGQVLTRDSRWHLDSRVTAGYARGMDQGYGMD